VKLGNNENDTSAMLSEAYGGEATKKLNVLSGIICSKTARMSKSQRDNAHHFLRYQGYFHFEFIP